MTAARLHVGLPNYGDFLTPRQLLDVAVAADDAGVDAITVVDHVAMGEDVSSYPYGDFPGGPTSPWLEPLTTLAAIAGRTSRVRLATGILIAPLRSPALLAKTAATLDVLSEGRLSLGVATGWQAKEFEAAGLEFAERGALLDDALAACKALWKGGPTNFSSPRLEFDGVYCHPTPVQPDGVPFWIGGRLHARNLERLMRFGSGWIPSVDARRDDVRAGAERIADALRAAGRDPAELRIRAGLPTVRDDDGKPQLEPSLARVPEMLAIGATDLYVFLPQFCGDPAEAPTVLRALADGFRANLA